MNHEQLLVLFKSAMRDGQAVLFSTPPADEAIVDRLWLVTRYNVPELAQMILEGKGGLYWDPDKLLDAAVMDKMIVVTK